MSGRVYIGTAGRGTLQLDDGRTMQLNGFGGLAELSDGTQILISGTGYLAVPERSSVQVVLSPSSGFSTTAEVNVTSYSGATEIQPTGTLQAYVNGVPYGHAVEMSNGGANLVIGADAFTNGAGNYTVKVMYSGDSNYSASSSQEIFAFSPS